MAWLKPAASPMPQSPGQRLRMDPKDRWRLLRTTSKEPPRTVGSSPRGTMLAVSAPRSSVRPRCRPLEQSGRGTAVGPSGLLRQWVQAALTWLHSYRTAVLADDHVRCGAELAPATALATTGSRKPASPDERHATHSPSGRTRPDDCMARMMRSRARARSTSGAALLLLWGI